MKKLRVLQVNKLYYPVTGGIERVVQQIAEGLNARTDMKVLVCKEKGIGGAENVNNVEVHRAGSFGVLFSLPISFSFFWKLRKLSKDRDILHFHMPFPLGDLAYLLMLSRWYQGKIVVWWHSDIVRQKRMMVLYRPLMNRFLKRADVIIAATKGHIEGSSYLKPYEEKCRIIPFGVDKVIAENAKRWMEEQHRADGSSIKERRFTSDESSYTHSEYEIKQRREKTTGNRVRFLFVGRLVYYKGCKVLIEAFQSVRDAELVMVGSGELYDELNQIVKNKGMESSVTFLGNITDEALTKEFQKCDVFVLPSIFKSEAFGLVQLEAMVYGKPVINTKLPSGVPYVSLHRQTGLTVEPENTQELAKAMQWMVDHEKERLVMGEKARERVLQEFQMDQMLDKVMEVYLEQVQSMK